MRGELTALISFFVLPSAVLIAESGPPPPPIMWENLVKQLILKYILE
jgi:hypothetical protein